MLQFLKTNLDVSQLKMVKYSTLINLYQELSLRLKVKQLMVATLRFMPIVLLVLHLESQQLKSKISKTKEIFMTAMLLIQIASLLHLYPDYNLESHAQIFNQNFY